MRRLALAAALIAAMVLAAPAAEAKRKGSRNLDVTQTVGGLIPDATPNQAGNPVDGVLVSTVEADKRFKGRRIRDVNVTVQTTGVSGGNPANDLKAWLTAPNGATTTLFNQLGAFGGPAASLGPLTLDDEANKTLGDEIGSNPFELASPYIGTAQPGGQRLAVMDDGPVRGTWTLVVLDTRNPPAARLSVLNSWRLTVAAGTPYLTK